MGSTVIVLLGKDRARWLEDFKADKAVQLGELIGTTLA
jgi:hypothetical protein